MKRSYMKRGGSQIARGRMNRGTKRLRAKPDPQMAEWSKAVLDRDGHKCQWPVLFVGDGMPSACRTRDDRIDPHHMYTRGRRPDKKYDPDAGIALCRWHHDWVGDHPIEAEVMGLIKSESYELAHKRKAMLA